MFLGSFLLNLTRIGSRYLFSRWDAHWGTSSFM